MAATPKLPRPATLDHLRKKEPMEKKVQVVLSDVPLENLRDLRSRLAETIAPKEKASIEKEIEQAEEELNDATVELRFRAIGRPAYDTLLLDHPPTDEQKKKYGDELLYDPETFPIALVAASCYEPKMTVEEATEIFDEWNGAEVSELFTAALAVNTQRRTVALANFSGLVRG